MVVAHQNPKSDQGSIRVGATGKVSALMMQELDSITSSLKRPTSCKRRIQTAPVSISCGISTKKLQQRKTPSNSLNNASGSLTNNDNHRSPGSIQRKKHARQSLQHIPMLNSEDFSVDKTPSRGKPEKRISQIVEIVDLKCGNPEGDWSSPINNQLRRLNFSKLAD